MKNKKTLFIVLLTAFISVILTVGISVVAITLTAKEIKFVPINSEWQVDNVEDAMNDLYNISSSISLDDLTDHTDTSVTLEEDKPIVIVYTRNAVTHHGQSNSSINYANINITGDYEKELSFKDGDSWWVDENSYYRKNGVITKIFTNVKAGTTIEVTSSTNRHILY